MNVVDSSGWLEFFAAGRNAEFFRPPIEDTAELLIPTLCLYEVFKRILMQRGETAGLQAAAFMQLGSVVDLSGTIALNAARFSVEYKLPMADSVILATAREHGATLWTQDADFKDLQDVRYIRSH